MDQPYRNFAKTLLQGQLFPKTAKQTPYDDVAWSLDLMLGVEVVAIDDPQVLALARTPLHSLPKLGPEVAAGSTWIVDHHGQAELATLRFALPDAKIQALTETWDGHPAGSLVITNVTREQLDAAVGPLQLVATPSTTEPTVALIDAQAPRIAVFHTWIYTQDSGWLRYTFERLGIPFTLIDKDDLREGKLRDWFDVIVIPSQSGLSLKEMIHEIDPRFGPLAYTKTDEFPSHGAVDSSEDITGGMGFAGLANLQGFVEAGGVVLGLGSGGVIAAEGGITRDVETSRPGGTPGSHVTVKVLRSEHPLAWGYETIDWVFRGNLPIYSVAERDCGRAVVQFGTKTWADVEQEADTKADVRPEPKPLAEPNAEGEAKPKPESPSKTPLVRSGLVEKPETIDHRPALLDVPVGLGRVVLYAWNPMHRHQNEHDFAFVTNALLFWDDFPTTPTESQMRGSLDAEQQRHER